MSDFVNLKDQLESLLRFRASEYAALTNAFVRESTPDSIREIIDAARDLLATGDPVGAGEDGLVLARSMAALDNRPFDEVCTKARTEYVRMFIGLRKIVVPIHESLYRGGSSRMMMPVTLSVRNEYAKAGFQVTKKNSEPDDHIGIELEFMSSLCSRCADKVTRDDVEAAMSDMDAQSQFFEKHLFKWAAQFAHLAMLADKSGFYGPWARYLIGYLEKDREKQNECASMLHPLCRAAGDKSEV